MRKLSRIVKSTSIIVLITLVFCQACTDPGKFDVLHPVDLLCENLIDPLGVDKIKPCLSWKSESKAFGQKQTAYRIIVASSLEDLKSDIGDIWDSGKINSSSSINNLYNGVILKSNQRYFWKLKLWDIDGNESKWSKTSEWTMGLIDPADWKAKWIGLDKDVGMDNSEIDKRRLSARYLRKNFHIERKVKRAISYVCGLGLSELYINGEKIGDHVLSPGLTEYNKRAFYVSYDVTKNLKQGKNVIGTILGNGRYFAPRKTSPVVMKTYGYPKLLLQINIEYADGTDDLIISDGSWKITAEGPIIANNEFDGEEYDARKELGEWSLPAYDDKEWITVESVDPPGERLESQMNPPIRITEEIKPVAVENPKPGMYIFDMGQNMVGWVELRVKGEKGTEVKMRFAETLKDNGMLFLDNLRSCNVTDIYTLKGEGEEVWEPRFTYHGFRFVEITGYPGEPDLNTILGKVVHDDVEQTGYFSCSNELINSIYKNIVWGIRGNYRSIPTDCPQRDERLGWLGDRAIESMGESFIFDINNLYSKWLKDIQDAQLESGSIADVAPSYWAFYNDNVTWAGAYTIIPQIMELQYGNKYNISQHYDDMKQWIEHMLGYIDNGLMPRDSYGDWCVPPESPELIHSRDPARKTSGVLLGTAYFQYMLTLMEKYAGMLDEKNDEEMFAELSQNMKEAFNREFLNIDKGIYDNGSQTSSVLPLAFGLVPEEYKKIVFDNLIKKIINETKGHIGTGLIGCQWLMRVLSDNGRPDLAYTILNQEDYPGWGYMVKKGATTIWELWNGDTGNPGMNSGNHVMLVGDLVIWLYEYMAGIKADTSNTGFKHIIMKPLLFDDLSYVNCSYKSPYGKITSNWTLDGELFVWDISIPANTTATVYFPADNIADIFENDKELEGSDMIKYDSQKGNRVLLRIGSGSYSFSTKQVNNIISAPLVIDN
ncbi:family 78 glycoside hydrolase catalytic domain [Bacteroidota bacterium]